MEGNRRSTRFPCKVCAARVALALAAMAAWLFLSPAARAQDDGASTLYLPMVAPGGAIIRVTTTADEMRKDGDCLRRLPGGTGL
jgi:hypothetical protein